MMDSYFSSDVTEFEEQKLHKITTNHPYMATLGLSVMTTGMLWRWWNKKDGEGNYVNQKYFAEDPTTIADKTSPSLLLLGQDPKFGDKQASPTQMSFQAWRKEGDTGAGSYVTKYIDGGHSDVWNFVQTGLNEANQPRTYTYDELELATYADQGWKFEFPNLVPKTDFEIPDGKGGKETIMFKGVDPITNVIALHEWIDHKENSDISLNTWSQKDFAKLEFSTDIQTSKDRYVEWSGYVPFYISTAKGDDDKDTFKCLKSDWVVFRLYLIDSSTGSNTNRGVAISKPQFAAPPVDPLGRKYSSRDDGRFAAFPEGSKAAEVVGELDMTFNEYTGKWEAGTQQMVGVVTQTIPRAQVVSAERLRNLPPEEMLRNPSDPNSHIIFGSGAAMPLNMQNGNPMQWTPNYAQASEVDENGKFLPICPAKSEEKATFRVFNASAKSLDTNQYVLLNKIDGLWFAIDFPSGIEDADVTASFDGKWDFSYILTNKVHYFRDSGFRQLDSVDIERGFHANFYKDDILNNFKYTNAKDLSNDLIVGGYCQMTSFDQMDKLVGGLRGEGARDSAASNKNGLGVTNPITGPNGEPIMDEGGYNSGRNTIGFFGCIFPDGYRATDIDEYRTARNYLGVPTVNVSGLVGEEYESSLKHAPIGSVTCKFFHDEIGKDVLPFNNGAARHDNLESAVNEQDERIPMFNDEDTSLTNLPADIALNAGPSGTNGQPIKNIHMVDQMYQTNSSNSAKFSVKNFFKYGQNWLHKVYDEGTKGVPDLQQNSFYDLKPRVPNRIMFRPLKDSAYMQYGRTYFDETVQAGMRQFQSQAITRRMSSKVPPVGWIAREREYNVSTVMNPSFFEVPDMIGNISALWNSYWGLQLNVDIPGARTNDKYLTSPKAFLTSEAQGARFHHGMWGAPGRQSWVHGGNAEGTDVNSTNPEWKDSNTFGCEPGGIGIIGAVATCTANTEIVFNTDQTLGCWSFSRSSAILGDDGTVWQWASWGVRNGYRDMATTNLYVKVYHNWPREQTIYDPRYYAVHHFNAGILDELLDSNNPDSYKVDFLEENLSQRDPANKDAGSKSYKYYIAQQKYDCDLRIPSSKALTPIDEPAINELHVLELGAAVYQTRASEGFRYVYESVPRSKWLIDVNRRGKLLPYSYNRRTIGVPKARIVLPDYSDGVVNGEELVYENGGYAILNTGGTEVVDNVTYIKTEAKPFYDISEPDEANRQKTFDPFDAGEDVLFIVKNPGREGYKTGDTFVVSDKLGVDFEMEVKAVDDNGRVKEIVVNNTGYDFSYTAFGAVEESTPLSNGRPVTFSSTGASVLSGGTAPTELGKGFNLGLVRGYVFQFVSTDEKPLIATASEYERLSIKSNSDQDKRGTILSGGEFFGLESGEKETTMEIVNQSPNNKYDLFFHFHNDIGHTFYGPTADYVSATRDASDEQYIDLTITTK